MLGGTHTESLRDYRSNLNAHLLPYAEYDRCGEPSTYAGAERVPEIVKAEGTQACPLDGLRVSKTRHSQSSARRFVK